MNGFYSIWSKPAAFYKKMGSFYMEDYEILTLALSALTWKEHNGSVYMYADAPAREFLEKAGLTFLFDDIYALKVDENINSGVFWAAGKLYALRDLKENAAMIDLDLIVWKNLDDFLKRGDVCAIHREELRPEVYPDFSFFKMKPDFIFPAFYDQRVLPVNTALLYINDDAFRIKYANEAISFMEKCIEERENLRHMVFAEQRLLPILASAENKSIYTMFELDQNIGMQDYFTHVWGHKNILKYNYDERVKFCKRIMTRLKNDYSFAYDLLSEKEEFKAYT